MKPVKSEVRSLYGSALDGQRRKDAGLPVGDSTMHLVFAGPPGTGKTTIARDIGQLYYSLGLLEKDPTTDKGFKEVRREDLVGSVMGQTEEKTREAFDSARGGVLFVDEAYSLYEGEQDMYGKQALTTLMALAENHRDDTVVIMAGYGNEMDKMFMANPGLGRRFPRTLHFPSYDADERYDIMGKFMSNGKYTIGRGRAAENVRAAIKDAILDTGTGNAGDVRNLWERIKTAQTDRLGRLDVESMPESKRSRTLSTITVDDVKRGAAQFRFGARVDEPIRGALVPTGTTRKSPAKKPRSADARPKVPKSQLEKFSKIKREMWLPFGSYERQETYSGWKVHVSADTDKEVLQVVSLLEPWAEKRGLQGKMASSGMLDHFRNDNSPQRYKGVVLYLPERDRVEEDLKAISNAMVGWNKPVTQGDEIISPGVGVRFEFTEDPGRDVDIDEYHDLYLSAADDTGAPESARILMTAMTPRKAA